MLSDNVLHIIISYISWEKFHNHFVEGEIFIPDIKIKSNVIINHIKHIRFRHTEYMDNMLKRLTNIEHLKLKHIKINNINFLKQFKHFRYFSTYGCNWNFNSDYFLTKCVNLRTIKFKTYEIKQRDIDILSQCPKLKKLVIGGISSNLKLNLNKLKYFKITKFIDKIDLHTLNCLDGCYNLRMIKIIGCINLTDIFILYKMPKLKLVIFNDCPNIVLDSSRKLSCKLYNV